MSQKIKLLITLAICFLFFLNSLSIPVGAVSDEVVSKQQIFYKVTDLFDAELKNLNDNLNGAKIEDNSEFTQKRNEFLKELSDFNNYNKDLKEKISNTGSAEDLKNLAINFKDWREKTYNSQAQIIINFALLLKQKEVSATAIERFGKIEKDIKKLTNLGVEQTQKLNSLLNDSKTKLNLADESFQKAKTILNDYLSASSSQEDIANATSTAATSTIATSTESATSTLLIASEKQFDTSKFQELIKESFEKIKSAYEIFLEMSALVKYI